MAWASPSGTVGVDIPAIGLHVTFNGQGFQIQLPYANFSHNTEGQCGEWAAGRPRGQVEVGEGAGGHRSSVPRHLYQQPGR